MAENELKECPCSNITIMQLFHTLKQKYPKIPDHIVSKVIEQNFHDKTACETILQKESYYYSQSYPGALILGNVRDQTEPLCNHCSALPAPQSQRSPDKTRPSTSPECTTTPRKEEFNRFRWKSARDGFSQYSENVFENSNSAFNDNVRSNKSSHSETKRETALPDATYDISDARRNEVNGNQISRNVTEEILIKNKKDGDVKLDSNQYFHSSSSSLGTNLGNFTEDEKHGDRMDASSESSAMVTDRTSESGCDSETKNLRRSQSSAESSSLIGERGIETRRWSVEDRGRKSAVVSGIISHSSSSSSETPPPHNYQVALECTMQPIPLDSLIHRDQTRSFTSVNLSLRPPSSEPQAPIEIQSGHSLTYTTSSFDPKKGYQSQLQIRIDPELLEKQRERKDLLARELQREKQKLRSMQNEMRLMQAEIIAQKPHPYILPKLKADIVRLKLECEKLQHAVDAYSGNPNSLPLGESNEEFYSNIYTGQRFQGEDGWSCETCTFRNHPLLNICETCDMPRLSLGGYLAIASLPNGFSNNNNSMFYKDAVTSTSASPITARLQEQ